MTAEENGDAVQIRSAAAEVPQGGRSTDPNLTLTPTLTPTPTPTPTLTLTLTLTPNPDPDPLLR